MSVQWLLKIVDGATGPLKNITAAARQAQSAIRMLGGEGLTKLVGDVEKVAKAETKVTTELQKQASLRSKVAPPTVVPKKGSPLAQSGASKAFDEILSGGGLSGALSALGPEGAAVAAVAGAAEQIAAAAGKLVAAGAELAIDATTFRENAVAAFESFAGSASAANGLYKQALDLSEKLGTTPAETITRMRKLLSAGVQPSDLASVITTIENASAGISERAGHAVEKALTKIGAKGFMDNRALTALAGAGIQTTKIYEALAARLGKSVKDVELMVRKGKVDSKDAIAAIQDVVNKQTGNIAERLGKSIPGLLNAIRIQAKDLFSGVDLGPIKGFLTNVLAVLKGPAGAGLKDSLGKFFGTLFNTLFGNLQGKSGAKKIEAVIRGITSVIDKATVVVAKAKPVVDFLLKLTELAGKAAQGKAPAWLSWLVTAIGYASGVAELIDSVEALFAAFDLIENYELDLSGIGDALEGIGDWFEDAIKSVAEFEGEFIQAGAELVSGLVQGIEDNASAIVAAVVDAVSSAIGAAKSALGIASPSSVFADIGGFTAAGFAQGVANDTRPSQAIDAMVRPPALGGAFGGAGGGAARGNTSIDVGGIQVHSNASDAKEVAKEVRREMQALLEEWTLELGAA